MVFSKEIISVLDYLCNKFGIAVDWTSDNVIPYLEGLCEKYIRYEVFTSIAWVVIVLVITGIVSIALSIMHRKANAVDWDDYEYNAICTSAIILWIAFIIMSLVSIITVGTEVFDIIECYTIPEKTILEYLNQLTRTMK